MPRRPVHRYRERSIRTGDRRLPGTGRLLVRVAPDGSETYYGTWYCNGRRIKRRIGPRRRRGDRIGLTERQAEDKLRELIAATDVPAPAAGRLTIEDVGAHYIDNARRRGRKKGTLDDIASDVRAHFGPYFRGRAIHTITFHDVIDLMGLLERKGLAPKTIRDHIGSLSALFNFAMAPQRRWATNNPCTGIELPPVPEPQEVRYLTLREVDGLLAHVRPGMFEQIDRPLFLTAAMTGMRKGELVALRWRDVDWNAARIRIRRNYTRGEFGTPKSRRSTRSVPMTQELADALRTLHSSSRWRGADDLVFAHPDHGNVLAKTNITRRMRAALKAAGLDDSHRFHDLRHTFGTHMAAAAVPMRTLQEWMGHRDLTTTQRYADYAPSEHEGEMVAAAFMREPRASTEARPALHVVRTQGSVVLR